MSSQLPNSPENSSTASFTILESTLYVILPSFTSWSIILFPFEIFFLTIIQISISNSLWSFSLIDLFVEVCHCYLVFCNIFWRVFLYRKEKRTWSFIRIALRIERGTDNDYTTITFPEAFSKALTISKTDVPFPVPKLYTSQVHNLHIHTKKNECYDIVP